MSTALPTVFIPALLCDERLYSEVIASMGDQIEAQVMLSPKPDLQGSVADILVRAPARFVLAGTSYGGRLAMEIAMAARHGALADGLQFLCCAVGRTRSGRRTRNHAAGRV